MRQKKRGALNKKAICECGGKIIAKQVTVDLRLKGGLVEFENVPVGVCIECGTRFYKGPVLQQVERLAQTRQRVKRMLSVPVVDYQPATSSP